MCSDAPESDVLSQTRTYEPTPEGFDPLTASAEALRRHGLPRRPDPNREPELARLWKRVFARPVKFETAELVINPAWRRRRFSQAEDQPAGLGWAGVVNYNHPQPATWVFGQWVVPWVSSETPGPEIQIGFWVGLDGAPGLDPQLVFRSCKQVSAPSSIQGAMAASTGSRGLSGTRRAAIRQWSYQISRWRLVIPSVSWSAPGNPMSRRRAW
jgi:hypothetical protein